MCLSSSRTLDLVVMLDHFETLLYLTTMGIDGLWKALEAVEQKVSLHNLAVGTGFIANTTGARGFRVGIDASGWMYRACNRHGITESPQLVALFARCSRLFRLPFIPIFVFDGPERPDIKRGKVIRGNDHPLTESFKLMLDGFGFRWLVAPGEAEATLSRMTASGIPVRVDAILTDDSDAFVFGASVVLRIRSEDNENYEASLYSADDISTLLGLSKDDFILIAILAGGDYSDGLRNCGVTTAIGLARAGLGRQLMAALSSRESMDLLEAWREALRTELRTNSSGLLPHRRLQLANNIPADFPNPAIINLYLHPIVSEPSVASDLVFRSPRLDILARFAEDNFQWGDSIGILDHFADHLFAGFIIRELVHRASVTDGTVASSPLPSVIKHIVGERRHKSTGYLAELRLTLSLDPAIFTTALQAIDGRRNPPEGAQTAVATWIKEKLPKVRAWVPKSMMGHVFPTMVLNYTCAQSNRTAQRRQTRQPVINPSSFSSASSSSVTAASRENHPINLAVNISHSLYGQAADGVRRQAPCPAEKRYTAISITYQGHEVLELMSDSEGEL
ncbi:PIN domain-like protein [Mycena capillaripes]|nr:PIN domain-like protein [Mycena capillaripes]